MSIIQFKGRPNTNVDELGTPSSKEAHVLNTASFGDEEESLQTCNEDPFSLDTYESLIAAHHKQGKDFILARVVTMLPETYEAIIKENVQVSEYAALVYKSFYAAHQINKTLFRTQPEEGLLHRMKAKNPMNNLSIVGDVHYFVVKASDPTVACFYASDDDFLMKRHVREYFKRNTINPEDVFLFTLLNHGSPTPMVSDPTNPNAVAMSMDQAIRSLEENGVELSMEQMTAEEVLRSSSNENAAVPGRAMLQRMSSWIRTRLSPPVVIEIADSPTQASANGRQRGSWFGGLFGRMSNSSDSDAASTETPVAAPRLVPSSTLGTNHSFRSRFINYLKNGYVLVAIMFVLFFVSIIGSVFAVQSPLLEAFGWSLIALQLFVCFVGGYLKYKSTLEMRQQVVQQQDAQQLDNSAVAVMV